MEFTDATNCTVCKSSNTQNLLNLNCGVIDGSTLYRTVRVCTCNDCGHVYNRLNAADTEGLAKYYNNEYALINLATLKRTNKPDKKNQFSDTWYAQLFNHIKPFVNSAGFILDVGCGTGGFLRFLNNQGSKNNFGLDVITKYVDYAKQNGHNVKVGNAETMPFDDQLFDCLVIDQVLEHTANPVNVFREARRVLKKDGILCVAVPDAARYDQFYFFDFYWFILREHIQHFDLAHLAWIGQTEGFELVSDSTSENPMMSASMILPNLTAVFRLTGNKTADTVKNGVFDLQQTIKKYILEEFERLNSKRKIIDKIRQLQTPVYVWGIGREFSYIYEAAGLKHCNIQALVDGNPYKQAHVTVDNRSIASPMVLQDAKDDSVLLITAYAHKNVIMNALNNTGYKGQIIEL